MRAESDAATPRSGTGLRRRAMFRIALGLVLIAALLLWNGTGSKLLDVLAGFRPEYLAVLLLLQVLLNGVSSLKWQLFLRDRGVEVSYGQLFRLYLIGRFFNNFLPSMVGGDITRAYMLGRKIKSQAASTASVTMERATGLIALTFLAVVFAAMNPEPFFNKIVLITISAAVIVCSGAVLLFSSRRVAAGFESALRRRNGKISRKLLRFVEELGMYRGRRRVMWISFAQSCLFQFLAGLNVYFACLSIAFRPDLLDVLVVTPAILILAMIPISPNNVGWWEWCFSVLLIDAGATTAEGVAVALTLRAVGMITSLVGGALLLFERQG